MAETSGRRAISCEGCGERFFVKRSHAARVRRRYCSLACKASPAGVGARFYRRVERSASTAPHVPGLGPCDEWRGSVDSSGYGHLWFDGKLQLAHRVAFFLTYKRWPAECALHRCDNRVCVNPEHLFEGSNADNVADRVAKGRDFHPGLKGAAHPSAKLDDAKAHEIARRVDAGERRVLLAEEFGVSVSTIGNIASGRGWAHLKT